MSHTQAIQLSSYRIDRLDFLLTLQWRNHFPLEDQKQDSEERHQPHVEKVQEEIPMEKSSQSAH